MSSGINAMPSPPPSVPRGSDMDDVESKPSPPATSTEQATTTNAVATPSPSHETSPPAPASPPPPTPHSTSTSPLPAKVTISSASALVGCESLSMSSPRHAASSPPPSASTSPRSNSFTKSSPHDKHMSPAMEWRNKSVSCDALRGFETSRKTYIDPGQSADRRYWELFCQEVRASRDHNARLVKFFTLKVQADLAYADSLRRLRLVLDSPQPDLPATAATTSSKSSKLNLQAASSCDQALAALGESQQLLCEKIEMFTNAVQRDVLVRPFQEMIAKYEETVTTMLADGDALDNMLHLSQRRVQEAFAVYDGVFRDMERHRHAKDAAARGGDKEATGPSSQDLWLAEMTYGVHVKRLQNVRVEYVKGMAALFHQFKTLEVLRVSVTQSSLDIFLRKQKLIFEELGNSMAEPLAIVQKIEPEKDLIQTIRRIPRNNTALALAAEAQETAFFSSFRSPLASPLLIRCGFLKYQVSSTMFKTWKDVFGVITQDRYFHVFELDPPTSAKATTVPKSLNEYVLESLPTNPDDNVQCHPFGSIALPSCRLTIAKGTTPTFEIAESVASTGLFSVFKAESTKRHIFQCVSQPDLVDWVVAAKRLIPDPVKPSQRR